MLGGEEEGEEEEGGERLRGGRGRANYYEGLSLFPHLAGLISTLNPSLQ